MQARLAILERKVPLMSDALTALQAQVSASEAIDQSALALINGIADRITAAGTDSDALTALATSLKAQSDALSAAIVANTPAAPTPAPVPVSPVVAPVVAPVPVVDPSSSGTATPTPGG